MKRLLIALVTLLSSSAFGQASPCNPAPDSPPCTVRGAYAFFANPVNAKANANKETALKQQANDVVTANRPTVAPPTFAARIHNSYEDFLNLFSFAINKVDESDNGQALIVRFNPLREGSTLIGTTLTVTQPAVADVVKNAITEDVRDKTVTALEKRIGSQNDLTFSASYSAATVRCGLDRPAGDRCWGRTPATYRDLVSELLSDLIVADLDSAKFATRLKSQFPNMPEGAKTEDQIVQSATKPGLVID